MKKRAFIVIEILIVFSLLLIVCLNHIGDVSFHGDESMWIHQSKAYEAFISGDFKSSLWKESYDTLTTNPITEYIIGSFRRLGGYKNTDLNSSWDFSLNDKQNIDLGNAPKSKLLWWSRLPMAILMVIVGLFVFILLRLGVNTTAGYIFLGLFITNSYFLTILRRATSEAPLLALISLAIFIGVIAICMGIKTQDHPQKSFIFQFILFIMMSIVGGIAGGAKLNGLLIILASIVLFGLTALTTKYKTRFLIISGICAVGCLLISGTMAYISINPYLYVDPINRINKQIQFRFEDWHSLSISEPPVWHDLNFLQSRQIVFFRVFQNYASIQIWNAQTVNIVFCLFGIYTLGRSTYRWLFNNKKTYTNAVILIVGLILSIPSLFTPLDWDRYYLLPVFFSTIFIAVGVTEVLRYVRRYILKLSVSQR